MSAGEDQAAVPVKQARSGRRGLITFLVVMIALIVGAAWYQEQITYFLSLRAWDRGAPARTVTQFLKSGRAGDRAEAGRYLDASQFQPFEEKGKLAGYHVATTMGRIEYRFDELAGSEEPQVAKSEFVFMGNGAAMVTVKDAAGRPIDYRLAMQEGSWKITEIRGGTVRR